MTDNFLEIALCSLSEVDLHRLQNLKSHAVVVDPEGSTPLIPKPAIGHDPDPVPSTCHPHVLISCILHTEIVKVK
jgi:hypothetical protein